MRVLKIGNEEYTFKFSIEASLYNECAEKITSILFGMAGADGKEAKKEFISTISNIPQTALHMFHAGLLEYHNLTFDDSKKLIAQYIKEHKNDETGSFYGIMEMLIEDMSNDGFFELIGLDKMISNMEVQAEKLMSKNKEAKTPQDHKKKQEKAKVTES